MTSGQTPCPGRWIALVAGIVLTAGIITGTWYGQLRVSLHGEYFNISRAIYSGRGFADPFGTPTGPTAWQGPLLPGFQAAILWLSDGEASAVVRVVVVLHVCVLILTGFLAIAIAWKTCGRAGILGAAIAYGLVLSANFRICFEMTSDTGMNLLFLDLFLVGLFWQRPLGHWYMTTGWGLLGGISALANPILGFVWGCLTIGLAIHQRSWRRLAVALFISNLVVTPWMIRNYLVLGRFFPVKSNLGYEFFQAQCLQPPGVLTVTAINAHPAHGGSPERKEYKRLGEPDYVSRKWEQFGEAVWDDPLDFIDRLASRFLCATLWFESPNPGQDERRPWLIWLNRTTHPLPFVALLTLLVFGIQGRLRPIEWYAIGTYVIYLLPYIAASYYDRYSMPLVAVKVLLVVWATGRLVELGRNGITASGQTQ